MLGRWVFAVWGAWLGTIGLAAALIASKVWNPNPVLSAGLPILMVAAWLGLLVAGTVRLIRGPRRDMALASLLAPYDHFRLMTTFRIERGTKAAGDDPYEFVEQLTLIRSGRFARARRPRSIVRQRGSDPGPPRPLAQRVPQAYPEA